MIKKILSAYLLSDVRVCIEKQMGLIKSFKYFEMLQVCRTLLCCAVFALHCYTLQLWFSVKNLRQIFRVFLVASKMKSFEKSPSWEHSGGRRKRTIVLKILSKRFFPTEVSLPNYKVCVTNISRRNVKVWWENVILWY